MHAVSSVFVALLLTGTAGFPLMAQGSNAAKPAAKGQSVAPPPAVAQKPPTPVIPDPRRNAVPPMQSFNNVQVAQTARVSAYLSSLQTLSGNFVQVGPDGGRTQGDFFIQKPGRVRFEYDPPSPIDIVADGTSVVVRDRNLATQEVYPLSQTPLRFLLQDRIDLMRDTNIVNVTLDELFVSITIEEKQALVGTSRLMLMFGVKDGLLKQWTVTDPQGYDTTVAVYNLEANKPVAADLFYIDFTKYPGGSQ
ncbi:MAG: outer membrane lipoprotein carrier protein LolA [Alphaproteobacteria bacterium]|nr:outer membrane lipoprotein carrier protein LolA [Alphaproteobacteria bacterium]